ncbi:ribosomal-processing cysteine protease Prp [Anaerocolumna sp. AGMB13025]|uniref:ribosomal-processing cysteine protease Prp n=1 Tax=Anaerocolumna sp. AGMB13025 TaxID=3039116 RepID=UPI00241DE38F|nr:ribosomal-processing cysteine protease Prp [Anaerocolumna sp. AGMB13025]WFR60091.1 ribosomal-processing cysteine protease Prp [Anaerocolumna sp. AGMB13025]
MIKISSYKNAEGNIIGFRSFGHAGYAQSGQDIVCAAVSVLIINTVNSIEHFTSDTFHIKEDEEKGEIDFRIVSKLSNESSLLLNSLFLGLKGIKEDYGQEYIKLI